jgi:Holliday junction resolvase RusA-like endonuclease
MRIEFVVRGVAIPKGSTKAFMRPGLRFPVVTADNTKTKPWQEQVRMMAQEEAPRLLWLGAVRLEVGFFLPRPKSLPKKVLRHVRKPDLDKLLRAIKDALKGVIYRDDAQVVSVVTSKEYAETPFVRVIVEEL